MPTLGTKAFLVTFNYKYKTTNDRIKKFIKSLNRKLPILKSKASIDKNTPHPTMERNYRRM